MSGALRRQLFIQVKKRYGCLFLWLLSFGHAKESNTPLGRNTKLEVSIQINERRRAKTKTKPKD